jgi:CheY-like chemotaxis protein
MELRESSPLQAHVLVIEDEPTVAQMMVDLLECDGYVVDTAANGLVALEKISERAYDVILSDLRMPELDGMGLYDALARQRPALLSRLIFITGSMEQPEYRRFLAGNPTPVIAKPFNVVDLQDAIQHVLDVRQRSTERT